MKSNTRKKVTLKNFKNTKTGIFRPSKILPTIFKDSSDHPRFFRPSTDYKTAAAAAITVPGFETGVHSPIYLTTL